ncbi:DUF3907 family protein [Anaerobacillus sp. MEB173]|uniref:DUF3907 family protein n=1 Tax=Anaerobacillus sp. MEB173 TaxID=3383345 RepID=UPI003F9369B1
MGNNLVKGQITLVDENLTNICQTLENYLNETTLSGLIKEAEGEDQREYFTSLLSSIRRVFVFCDEGREACEVILKGQTFRKVAAEKTLYWVYHHCIEEFFNPRIDNWYENSRAAYTGKNSIKFAQKVPSSLETMMAKIEGPFQTMREELEYYETDYQTKTIQTK